MAPKADTVTNEEVLTGKHESSGREKTPDQRLCLSVLSLFSSFGESNFPG